MRDCEAYMEQISVLLDGELGEYETEVLMAHLDTCPECRIFYDAFTSISENTASLAAAAPDGFAAGVMLGIEDDVRMRTLKRQRFGIGRITTVAACLAVVLFAASRLGRNDFSGGDASLLGSTEGLQNASSMAADAPEAAPEHRPFAAAGGDANFGSEKAASEEPEDFDTIVRTESGIGGALDDADYSTTVTEGEAHPAGAPQSGYVQEGGYAPQDEKITEIATIDASDNGLAQLAPPAATGAPAPPTVASLNAVLEYSNFLEVAANPGVFDFTTAPAMTMEAVADGEFLTITLWEADGKLYCGAGSVFYIAEGTLEGFLAFIAES